MLSTREYIEYKWLSELLKREPEYAEKTYHLSQEEILKRLNELAYKELVDEEESRWNQH